MANYDIGTSITLQARIVEQLFYNEETTYGIYKIESVESKKSICFLTGNFPYSLLPNIAYTITGTVSLYKEEKQIKLETIYMPMPETELDMVEALKSIKGLNKLSLKIVEKYGLNSIVFFISNPSQLASETKGLSLEQAQQISMELQLRYAQVDIRDQLIVWGFTARQAEAITQKLGQSALIIIRKNPYELIQLIHGIGFKTIDKLAIRFGFNSLSEARIMAAIRYCLSEAASQGHCFILKEQLLNKLSQLVTVRLSPFECASLLAKHNKNKLINYEAEGASYSIKVKDMLAFMDEFDAEPDDDKREQMMFVIEGCTAQQLENFIAQLAEEESIVIQEERVYLREYYIAELKFAYKVIQLLLYEGQAFSNTTAIAKVLEKGQYKLEAKQLEAVQQFTAHEGGFMILNGSAGCGKTYTLNIILEVLEKVYAEQGRTLNVKVMAPTGKAAQVATVATKRPATTIHRGLQWKGDGGFQFNEKEPLLCDCLVVDESSMLDIRLAYQLSRALQNNCKVIFMGDTKQLQSVGAGNVLHDLIRTGLVPIVTLDVVKRQGKDSGIVENARRIIDFKMIQSEKEKGDSFFIETSSVAQTLQMLLKGIQRLLNQQRYSLNDIQVLTPMRKGLLGVDYLNYILQQTFNKQEQETITYFNKSIKVDSEHDEDEHKVELHFYIGDKVIHLVNDYTMQWYSFDGEYKLLEKQGITNGECGVITAIKPLPTEGKAKQIRVTVKYDEGFVHYINPGAELDHCYAMTIHKSQGSQWPAVFMPIATEQRHMLTNSLMYTGFTRAKQFQCVIGDTRTVKQAILRDTMESRLTSLHERFIVEA